MPFPVLTTSLALLRQVASGIPAGQLDNPTPCSDWIVAQVLLHAAGDQHAWASSISSSPPPADNPFTPAKALNGSIDDLIAPAIQAATTAWAAIDPAAGSVPTPLPPCPARQPTTRPRPCCATSAATQAGRPDPRQPTPTHWTRESVMSDLIRPFRIEIRRPK